jgi:hypothetical protein
MKTFEITFMTTPPQEIELEGPQTSINGLSYERVPCRGVRFKFGEMNVSPIGHMWFMRGTDLRRRTLRIYYSGKVPVYTSFFISRSSLTDRYRFPVELVRSEETRAVELVIPDKAEFKETSIFGFYFERRGGSNRVGEFSIEKVEILEAPALVPADLKRMGL